MITNSIEQAAYSCTTVIFDEFSQSMKLKSTKSIRRFVRHQAINRLSTKIGRLTSPRENQLLFTIRPKETFLIILFQTKKAFKNILILTKENLLSFAAPQKLPFLSGVRANSMQIKFVTVRSFSIP